MQTKIGGKNRVGRDSDVVLPGVLFILSGPSGVGKNTIAVRLLSTVGSENLKKVVTITTRPPRVFERDGIDYHFVSWEKFAEGIRQSEFLEYANVHGGAYYGSPRTDVENILSSGANALLLIDTAGVAQILSRKNNFRTATVFVAPKSLDDLRERIIGRGTETKAAIAQRIKTAENEVKMAKIYDHVVVSGSRDEDFAAVLKIYQMETQN
ncbi:MAG: guanylate kinase [Puniceicoccales bacterium]|nr:guanylate kinase [Puniceicoccales bacterium]